MPKDCYSGYYVTCKDDTNAFFNSTFLGKTSDGLISAECSNLTSGTKYTIKSTVYYMNNEQTNNIETRCTSKFNNN